tara:strand:- start:2754 stop:2936 length:183 start_codon:yes stop_codon:yes gene_type:complete
MKLGLSLLRLFLSHLLLSQTIIVADENTQINFTNKVSKLENFLEGIEVIEDPKLIEPYQF